jgi:ATP-binding cassette subfamily B protein
MQFAKELRLFGLGEYFLGAFRDMNSEIHTLQRQQQGHELKWQTVLSLLSSITASAAFAFVIVDALRGRIGIGDVTLYVSAVASLQAAFFGVVFALASLHESMLFYQHLTKLLLLPETLPVADPPCTVPVLRHGIEVRNVSFRYGDEHSWVLRHLDMTIPAGECVALVGRNGAGKSTLVKLLTRLYDPIEGEILWDGIDIRSFDPAELRQRMGTVFQDFSQFDLTVHQNIGLGDVGQVGDLERVRAAAVMAGVDNLIDSLPQGYQTNLSRWLIADGHAIELSGGEWQKIALARMFMRNARVLLLDEPTAALDAQAEHDVHRRIARITAGRTCLLITHMLSTVRMADKVAVLEGGKIAEWGTHSELLSLNGTYAKLYNIQAERYSAIEIRGETSKAY